MYVKSILGVGAILERLLEEGHDAPRHAQRDRIARRLELRRRGTHERPERLATEVVQ